MQLPPQRINACRAVVSWCARAAGIALIACGGYLVLKRVLLGLAVGDLTMIFQVYEEVGETQSFSRGLAMVIVGAALGLLARRIATWIVTPPHTGCPGCGYEKVDSDRCPECGLTGFNAAPPPTQ